MVVYNASGRVEIAYEEYLEQEAKKASEQAYGQYLDQIEVCKQRAGPKSTNDVQIIIDTQHFRTLYCEARDGWGSDFEWITGFEQDETTTISRRVCRETLILCSSTARDHFTYNPGDDQLHLPVVYPRAHRQPPKELDDQMAFIRAKEIEEYVLPWLDKVKKWRTAENKQHRELLANPGGPIAMDIPTPLLDKIHLYNVMLQLGLPRFIQRPLVEALISQLNRTRLSACHLDTLEITVGRFYSRGLAILDPVINHVIGTYYLRTLDDRRHPEPAGRSRSKKQGQAATTAVQAGPKDRVRADGSLETRFHEEYPSPVDFGKTKRKYLKFAEQDARRSELVHDTYILPPELAVLGHCVRHWSGVRRNGSVAAAHTGFPLNTGLSRTFVRRDASVALDVADCEEERTNQVVEGESLPL
ncbi:uncharacterized protein SETTUDRAFT_102576 [Exserohilum turcica Et28A]|uniref:Uncharacterized protein n=1 Tax=Exserohilum turcicum (strain 28A) TaxID=671987 RepID=R0KQG1_EXST2|nr:uncharacterized protein SETTUDRAFT_102576 [Exserohilum turcica Et28A]EOA90067.1 hypothetical protein SETTUDRAFT_102576 [Exserohilum turcica Et28A]